MRILRYPLEIVDYQQLQPIWPGNVLSVAPGRLNYGPPGAPQAIVPDTEGQGIDLWAVENEAKQGDKPAPLLGVWIVRTGAELPADLYERNALFHGTCVMANSAVWHVWTAVVGTAPQTPTPMGEVSSHADIVNRIRERHAGRTQTNG